MPEAALRILISRLSLLIAIAGICGVAAAISVKPVRAAAPLAKVQAPGVFRMQLGDFELTALSDGATSLDVVKLLNEPAEETETALQKSFLSNPLETSVNVYLINTGAKLILVDAGGGAIFGPALGKLQSNLQAAGYKPEQIDDILLTHMHRDHVGGLATNGTLAFPNATIHADKRESGFWLSKENLDKAPPELKVRFQGVMATLGPYVTAGRYQPFESDSEILPNVRSVASYGHTVGHTIYVVESKGHQLWLIGDLINVASVQLDHPSVSIAFDSDGNAAAASRMKILASAAQRGVLVGAAHLPFPRLGHLRATGATWQWLPTDSSTATR